MNTTHTLYFFGRLLRSARAIQGPQATTVRMKKNELLSIARPLGCRIDCIQGGVWITQDSDERDTLLSAGEHHVADRRTRLIVQALEAGVVRIAARAA
ncbi:DUF2917 domain-containing protein [Hydrogenophaga sp.]|uniref:DUF2917 domain-containing protein n=1 Tax=Hydrogenophaga sp. TaxID=1904254 RepID=UPI003F71E9B5